MDLTIYVHQVLNVPGSDVGHLPRYGSRDWTLCGRPNVEAAIDHTITGIRAGGPSPWTDPAGLRACAFCVDRLELEARIRSDQLRVMRRGPLMGNQASEKKKRQRLRRRLREQGCHPDFIEAQVRAQFPDYVPPANAAKQQAPRKRRFVPATEAEIEAWQLKAMEPELLEKVRAGETAPEFEDLDDAGYQPTKVDSLLTGQARVTGATAKAVRRGTALTKHEHDRGTR